MIENLKTKKYGLFDLWYFLKSHVNQDFYLTEYNRRVFITNLSTFKRLLKQSHNVLVSKESCQGVNGIILLWKSKHGEQVRNYIKINAINRNIVDKLLTCLLWNYNKDIYIKINKYSPYLNIFRDKKFIFLGGRGKEFLLVYKKREKKYDNSFKSQRRYKMKEKGGNY